MSFLQKYCFRLLDLECFTNEDVNKFIQLSSESITIEASELGYIQSFGFWIKKGGIFEKHPVTNLKLYNYFVVKPILLDTVNDSC